MKKIYYIICIIILFFMNITLMMRIPNNKDKSQAVNSDEIQQLSSLYNLLYKNTFIRYQSENVTLSDIIVQQQFGEATNFQSLFSDRPKLVFRYSERHCNTTNDEILQFAWERKNNNL
jgi:hypothetical protein